MKNEKWKGKFSYKLDDESESRPIQFELDIQISDGSFSGITIDDEFKVICDISPVVRGFIDNEFVSFVITYPYAFIRNDFKFH